jgi:hypothetical protein
MPIFAIINIMKKIVALSLLAVVCKSIVAQNNSNWSFTSGLFATFAPTQTSFANNIVNNDTNVVQLNLNAFGISGYLYPKYHFTLANDRNSNSRRKRKQADDKKYTLSVGAPISLGIGFGAINNNSNFNFMYHISPSVDINFGNCRPQSTQKIGAYFGLGLGITNTNGVSGDYQFTNEPYNKNYRTINKSMITYRPSGLGFGPLVHAGLEVGTNNKFSIMGSYQHNVIRGGLNYYSIGLQFPFNSGARMW